MAISKGYFPNRSRRPAHNLPCSQANILIDHSGHACLAGFSLLTIASDQPTIISSFIEGSAIQWMSPELLDPERFGLTESRPTRESDCYALGMVIYEVLSGQTPFAPSTAPVVIWKVLGGQRPGRPEGDGGAQFTDDLWGTLEHCWMCQPNERTSAKAVLECLQGTPPLLRPDVGGIAEPDTDDQSFVTAHDSSVFSRFRLRSQTHLDHRCGITGSKIACSGNGLPVPSQNPPCRATTVSGTLSPSQSDPQAYPNCPRGTTGPQITHRENGRPVPPYNHLPSVTEPKILRDGGELLAPQKMGGSKESWNRRLACKVREKSEATTKGIRKLGKTM